jgi:hypothetical protein
MVKVRKEASRTEPSSDAMAITLPLRSKLTRLAAAGPTTMLAISLPVLTSHTCTMRFHWKPQSLGRVHGGWPHASPVTAYRARLYKLAVNKHQVTVIHRSGRALTTPSASAEARMSPTRVYATLFTAALCPYSVATVFPVVGNRRENSCRAA